jgi:heterodisulfide reductase subunit A
MNRIGVFCCWCGSNIAGVLDLDRVLEETAKIPGVAHTEYYKYFCSQPGQEMVINAIREHELDGVVMAACSPSMHEGTFRKAAQRAGLNEYQLEIVNVREQCSWVHQLEKDAATDKAIKLIAAMVEKTKQNEPLTAGTAPVVQRALVIGAGISGMQAALDIANGGCEVVLVEKEPSIGGHMAQLSETFPTLDCSQCIMTPRMVEVAQHENIRLMTYSNVDEVTGNVGNFHVKVRTKAAFVDRDTCTGCGLCIEKCPAKTSSEFSRGLENRKAIYVNSPQAVPNQPVIDAEHCMYLLNGKCGVCKKVCEIGAIDYEQEDRFEEIDVGAIVVATGYDLYDQKEFPEFGGGEIPDVIDGLQFERLNSASGPTLGEIRRPSDGKIPKQIVFIQCCGSRDPENGVPYCSRICCMYTGKQAMLYKHKVHDGQAYVFYMDIRAGGKGYEEFIQRGIEETNTIYFRGRVSRLYRQNGKVMVSGVDTLSGQTIEIPADMVVLATAIVPSEGAAQVAETLNVATSESGFFAEAHVKLRPVETQRRGIFLAGCAQAPKDIPDAVSQAGCAASKALALLASRQLKSEAQVAIVDEERCAACGMCVAACPYGARTLDEERNVAEVDESLCEGCGACVATCLNKACELKNLTSRQISTMVGEL